MFKKVAWIVGSAAMGILLPLTVFNPFVNGSKPSINLPLSKALNTLNGQKTDESATNDKPLQDGVTFHDSNDGTNGTRSTMDSSRARSVPDATTDQYQIDDGTETMSREGENSSIGIDHLFNIQCFGNYRAMNFRGSPMLADNVEAVIPCGETVKLLSNRVVTDYHGIRWLYVEYQSKSGYVANVSRGNMIQ